ncbi:MAG: YggT family protein [Clostridiales bacterium]|nr:YggT family protein [Clostridia bacterium]MCR5353402.1 YggT family protein [Clostridiales bacterium]
MQSDFLYYAALIVSNSLKLIFRVLWGLMFIRAILSWIQIGENKFTEFVYNVTEIVILPVRKLLEKLNIGNNLPIDISFTVTFILIAVISAVLL